MSFKRFREYLWIISGSFVVSVGIVSFLLPSKISSGGVSSIGTILYYVFNVPLFLTNIFFNVILFLLGYKFLGKESLFKTIVGIVSFSVFLKFSEYISPFKNDIFAATLTGGLLMGVGIGMVIRAGGSTGGTDFAGLIISKFIPYVSVPKIIFAIDMIIIICSGIVFKSLNVVIYSGLALFVAVKVGDVIMCIGNAAKNVFIISEKGDIISSNIMKRCSRGVTGVYCRGMYLKSDKIAIMCVVSPRQVSKILDIVAEIDMNAFIIISDVKEVVGKGFNKNKNGMI